jgi:hypothetical protein
VAHGVSSVGELRQPEIEVHNPAAEHHQSFNTSTFLRQKQKIRRRNAND